MQVASDEELHEAVEARDWQCKDQDTRYLTHSIHRYSGKFIPQIARNAIELVSSPGELVADPYCGSGTALLESALLGRRSIGFDLNPLAALISRVKVTPLSADDLRAFVDRYQQLVSQLERMNNGPTLFDGLEGDLHPLDADVSNDPKWLDEWYRKWFGDEVLIQLIHIWNAIGEEKSLALRNIAQVAFSDILRRVSMAASGYPNVMYDKRRPDRPLPARLFGNRLESICSMVEQLAESKKSEFDVEVKECDAGNTGMPDESVDAIVTHPPYIGSVPYAEYGLLSLTWLGADAKKLDSELTGGRRQRKDVVDRFKLGYQQMLVESYRILKKSRYLFLMVGNPKVRGEIIDLGDMSEELAAHAGFELAGRFTRKGMNRRSNQMGDEEFFFFRK